MKKIFIGGLGRSGTTIALSAMSFHPALYAIPIETKFLVEADGFYDLSRALTHDYSTATAAIAVNRFNHLMRCKVTGIEPSEFTQLERLAPSFFDLYDSALDEFMEVISYRNYFQERHQVITGMQNFLEKTFDRVARISDKIGWAEKTPANFWRLDFLRELCPDSYFIHCLRDPRQILASLMQKGWIDSDPYDAAIMFEGMLAGLSLKRRIMLKDERWHEFRLEDLENQHTIKSTMNGIAKKVELEPFSSFAIESVAEKISNYHKSKAGISDVIRFTPEQAHMINQILLPWILELGYSARFPEVLIKQPELTE